MEFCYSHLNTAETKCLKATKKKSVLCIMNGVTFILLWTPRVCCYNASFRGSTIDILTEVPAKWLHFWESYTHRWPEIVPVLFVFARWRRKTQEDGGQKEMETTEEQTLDKHRPIRVNTGFVYKPRKQGLCHILQKGTLFPWTESHGLLWPPGFCWE